MSFALEADRAVVRVTRVWELTRLTAMAAAHSMRGSGGFASRSGLLDSIEQ